MTSANNNNNIWIADTVTDFIRSPIWSAPINTFIDRYCATFDYDDEPDNDHNSSIDEQTNIHTQYVRLVDLLIRGLGQDLDLDQTELRNVCQMPTTFDDSIMIDESHEQLYAARDFQLFQEMMRRRNLILQLQALVALQLQWGLLKQSDAGDDLVLALLLQATTASSSSRRGSIDPPQFEPIEQQQRPRLVEDNDDDDVVVVQQPRAQKKRERPERRQPVPVKEERVLPDLRRKGGLEHDADWYRQLKSKDVKTDHSSDDDDESKETVAPPKTIANVPDDVLRDKLRELTLRSNAAGDDEAAAAIASRKNFLQQQRDLIVDKKRADRTRDFEQQATARPQSAAHVARRALATTSHTERNKPDDQEQQNQLSNDELDKRRAMAAKLRREVVDKR